jgi:hypothetical protein
MVKVITSADRKRVEAAKKVDQPKFRLTVTFEPTVDWIETIQPGIFSVVMELGDIVGDPANDEDFQEVMQGVRVPNAAVIANYLERQLAGMYTSLNGYLYDDMNFGDHCEFTSLDVEDVPI